MPTQFGVRWLDAAFLLLFLRRQGAKEKKKAVGESLPPSKALTGPASSQLIVRAVTDVRFMYAKPPSLEKELNRPASLRRTICAPAEMSHL